MTDDPAEPEFQEIEVEGPAVAEVDSLPYWIVREQGVDGVSMRMVRSWVFDKVMCPETPLNLNTISFMEMASQWIANGATEELKLKVVTSKPSASRPREE